MPSDNNNFIVGICNRTQGATAFVDVKAQSIDGMLNDVSSMSHNLFGNNGEIEVKSSRPAIRQGDWVLARPVLDGPPKRQRHVAATGKRLVPFEDLSSLYAPEAARRLLVETGRQDGFVGDKVFRISLSDIIEVRMAVSADGRSRISHPEDLTTLPVWSFLQGRHVRVPTSSGIVDLFARDSGASQSGFVNWCSDVEFVRQVIGSFADGDATDDVLKRAAEFLAAHAGALEGKLTKTELLDPRIGQEIMRARKLADLLKSQDDMLKEFLSVLRGDPEIKKQLSDRIEELAKETIDAQREALARDMTAAFDREFEERRRRGSSELDQTMRELETGMLVDLERRIADAEQEALSALSVKRHALKEAVLLLEDRQKEASGRLAVEEERLVQTKVCLDAADAELTARKEEVDRLVRIRSLVDGDRHVEKRSVVTVPGARPAAPARSISLQEVPEWVASCALLSAEGKSKYLKAVACLCAGGMPVLTGLQIDEFADVLAALLGSGSFVSFDCDPTVITFDDLWVRPGSGSPTALGEAFRQCEDSAVTRFCVIRNVDRSAAQVWVQTLSDKLRRRQIPSNMLVCLTIGEPPSPGVEQMMKRLSVVDTSGSIVKAASITTLSRRGEDAIERQLDVAGIEEAPAPENVKAIGKLLVRNVQVGLADVAWFTRLFAAARTLLAQQDVDLFLLSEAEKRSPPAEEAPNSKPGLRVIDAGGASNA